MFQCIWQSKIFEGLKKKKSTKPKWLICKLIGNSLMPVRAPQNLLESITKIGNENISFLG